MAYCSQPGVTPSQPGVSMSTTTPAYDRNLEPLPNGPWTRLNLRRHYPDLPNEFGGRGRSKPLDGDGMLFRTPEEARQWAIDHGYLAQFFFPSVRARRLETAREFPEFFDRRSRK